MHNKVICEKCGIVILQCRCFEGCNNTILGICKECLEKEGESEANPRK
jgi:hypothetical protein